MKTKTILALSLVINAVLVIGGLLALAHYDIPRKVLGVVYKTISEPKYEFEDEKLPRVLIIGDSISIGYTQVVREQLNGRATVNRIPGNSLDTRYGLQNLDYWLDDHKWDLILFNFGLHDMANRTVSPNKPDKFFYGYLQNSSYQYERNLKKIVDKLKATGARLLWCNTIPSPPNHNSRIASDVALYNEIAFKIMNQNQIPLIDAYSFCLPILTEIQPVDDVHLNGPGYVKLGIMISEHISPLLPAN
jgi:acyl-CoA thioesterase-1